MKPTLSSPKKTKWDLNGNSKKGLGQEKLFLQHSKLASEFRIDELGYIINLDYHWTNPLFFDSFVIRYGCPTLLYVEYLSQIIYLFWSHSVWKLP